MLNAYTPEQKQIIKILVRLSINNLVVHLNLPRIFIGA